MLNNQRDLDMTLRKNMIRKFQSPFKARRMSGRVLNRRGSTLVSERGVAKNNCHNNVMCEVLSIKSKRGRMICNK